MNDEQIHEAIEGLVAEGTPTLGRPGSREASIGMGKGNGWRSSE